MAPELVAWRTSVEPGLNLTGPQDLNHEAHQEHEGLPDDVEILARTVVDAGLKGHRALGYGLDMLAGTSIVIEVKAVDASTRLHEA